MKEKPFFLTLTMDEHGAELLVCAIWNQLVIAGHIEGNVCQFGKEQLQGLDTISDLLWMEIERRRGIDEACEVSVVKH